MPWYKRSGERKRLETEATTQDVWVEIRQLRNLIAGIMNNQSVHTVAATRMEHRQEHLGGMLSEIHRMLTTRQLGTCTHGHPVGGNGFCAEWCDAPYPERTTDDDRPETPTADGR